jgi:nitrate reductase NapE component
MKAQPRKLKFGASKHHERMARKRIGTFLVVVLGIGVVVAVAFVGWMGMRNGF